MIRVALMGNPNVGKSVIFNNLTGSHQKVGNWPGKTVEKKEGFFEYNGEKIYVVDLPGTYSLTAYSVEEIIARNYIVEEKPDVVVVVIDASNLERNLYLVLQVLELGAKVIVALNKMDLAKASSISIDTAKLEKLLGVPVVPMIAPKKIGIEELCRKIVEMAKVKEWSIKIRYGELEKVISELTRDLEKEELFEKYNTRWLAIKLLEGDPQVLEEIEKAPKGENILGKLEKIKEIFEEKYGDFEIAFVEARYDIVKQIIKKAVKGEKKLAASDALDQALLDKYLGIPIFISILWMMFQFTFIASTPFSNILSDLLAVLSEKLRGATGIPHLDYLLFGEYGVLNGIGTILSFIPLIMTLYFAMSLLEDSGYMARAAFLIDRAMKKLGLTGKNVIPIILGFGCNIAGVYGTRIIAGEEDRIIAIVTNPLIPCTARLAVFTVIAAAFWEFAAVNVLLSLYILGILLSVLMALALRKTVFKGIYSPFIVELPPYQMPSLKVAVTQMWIRGSLFFKKAGTTILLGLLVIGLLATTNASTLTFTENVEESLLASLGKALQLLFEPLNWDWRLVVAAFFGFVAKEIVIGATAMLYGASEEGLPALLNQYYDPLTMYAYMVFILVYVPCIATLAAIRQETGSWKWTIFTMLYEILLAYGLSFLIVHIGRFLVGAGI